VSQRRPAAGQQRLWNCPKCGLLYMVEETGEVIRSRHYGTSRVVIFRRADTGDELVRCICGKLLHWLFNGDAVAGLPGRAR
jgi:hypothetical protein